MQAILDPRAGLTVESLSYRGTELIIADMQRKAAGATYGIPILFPTPNRVRDSTYLFANRRYSAQMHGFVFRRAIAVEAVADDRAVGAMQFDGTDPLFPHAGSFKVAVSLQEDTIRWDFSVTNASELSLAYGIALHPFFIKRKGMHLVVNTQSLMEDVEKYPTGGLIPNAEAPWDFTQGVAVDSLAIDHVFVTEGPVQASLVSEEYTVEIVGSEIFDRTVIYTAEEQPFICVEPQSCSTDAHNLAEAGFGDAAALVIVEPGQCSDSWVEFRIKS